MSGVVANKLLLLLLLLKECNISILEECVSLGTKRTLESSRRPLSVDRLSSPTRAGQPAERTVDALLQASQMTVFRHINNIINMLPMPHEVVNFDAKSMPAEDQYREKMEELFTDSNWHDSVYHLSKAMLQYLTSLKLLPWRKDIPEESVKDIGRFATLFLEVRVMFRVIESLADLIKRAHSMSIMGCYHPSGKQSSTSHPACTSAFCRRG